MFELWRPDINLDSQPENTVANIDRNLTHYCPFNTNSYLATWIVAIYCYGCT